ncbi:metallophosphatase [Frankia sp. R43]|uniref:metallophosphoesterase n=1 Tax=Frankia sp. R43 TaxID=269536 RepID=UPI0006C9F441|nr:metallophosphoesterase [Frankia sp. R43]KPM51906.1 metallophosphatase [Frankia sp. R43]
MFLIPEPQKLTHTVIQISDTHIVPEGSLMMGKVDTHANLVAALEQVEKSGVQVDALLLTGDLADKGELDAYRRLRDTVEPVAERIGAPVLYVMGNHDSRGPFREGLLGAEPTADTPHDYVHWAGDLRIIVLDSTEPDEHAGLLSDAQLGWLADELATAAPAGTVLALHHPPVPSPVEMLNGMILSQSAELADVLRGSDVKIVVCGHAHHASAGSIGGVPVWVAGATAYSARTLGPADQFAGLTGGFYTRLDVFPLGAVATSVPVDPGAAVYEMNLADMAELAAEYGLTSA